MMCSTLPSCVGEDWQDLNDFAHLIIKSAQIHSYTQSLRYQLKTTNAEVIELIPPYVQTTLAGDQQANDPRAMPLDEFIDEAMSNLKTQPDMKEVCVKKVYPLRFSAEHGQQKYEEFFQNFNDTMHS
jgi:uncharacterized oxidoreductase